MLSIPLWSFYGLCHVLSFKSSLFPLPRLSCRRAVLVRHLASLSSLFLPALYQVCLFLSCFLFGNVHVVIMHNNRLGKSYVLVVFLSLQWCISLAFLCYCS